MNDAIVWITIGFALATLAVLFGGPVVLAALGVPFPHALYCLAVGLMLVAAIPPGRLVGAADGRSHRSRRVTGRQVRPFDV